jgi:hypothetical protein
MGPEGFFVILTRPEGFFVILTRPEAEERI